MVTCTIGMTYLNYRGLKVVGRTAVLLTLFILSPFVVLTLLGAPKIDISNWAETKSFEVQDLVAFINVMFW